MENLKKWESLKRLLQKQQQRRLNLKKNINEDEKVELGLDNNE